jgi:glycosyltransferase involved in cell wall biosynthesis
VHLPGACENIDAQFAQADLFVLSSRYEGFPNVLVEAMSAGTPVVSFDCPDGPSDIIRHGQTGLLVAPNDSAELAKAMRQLMLSAADRRRFGAAGRHDMQRFSLEVVLEQWERLFDDVQSNG